MLCNGYAVGLLAAAAGASRRASGDRDRPLKAVVLVPAHDEEGGIAAAVQALLAAEYESDLRDVVVIADNCGDATAEVAREAGATVWERTDPANPGKGQALAWAIDRVWSERTGVEMIAVVDADCFASPTLLRDLSSALAGGADAAQARYEVSNPDEATASALRTAAFALVNVVRPLGKDRLGLSCGLLGTGMAFSAATLRAVPWEAFSITEDREYHLRLVTSGRRVSYVNTASVTSPMPTTSEQADSQQMRWDAGNARLTREWLPRLLSGALSGRDVKQLHAGLELVVAPQSVLLATSAVAVAGGAAAGSAGTRRVGVVAAALQGVYILAGLRVAGAPPAAYSALAHAPLMLGRRLAQQVRIAAGKGPSEWVRTERHAAG